MCLVKLFLPYVYMDNELTGNLAMSTRHLSCVSAYTAMPAAII